MVDLAARDDDMAVFVAKGELSADEIYRAYPGYITASPPRLVLLDLTAATLTQIATAEIQRLARGLATLGRGRRPPGKCAMLCGRTVDYGVARMLQIYLSIESYPASLAAFMDRKQADAWLAEAQAVR